MAGRRGSGRPRTTEDAQLDDAIRKARAYACDLDEIEKGAGAAFRGSLANAIREHETRHRSSLSRLSAISSARKVAG